MLNAVALDSSGGLVAAPNYDGGICIWNTLDGLQVTTLTGHLRIVSNLAFSNNKYLLASGSNDYTVCLWNLEQGNKAIWSREFDYTTECITISPDSTLLALATKYVDIILLDIATGATTKVLKGHSATVRSVAFTSESQTLASSSADGTVRLWNIESGLEVRQFNSKSKADFNCVAVSPDGKYIAAGDWDGRLYLWQINDTKPSPFMKIRSHTKLISSIAFSPDGKWLVSSSWDKTICVTNFNEFTRIHE